MNTAGKANSKPSTSLFKRLGTKNGLMTLALWVGVTASAHSEDLTDVDKIVEKANHTAFYQGDDGRAEARMLIVDGQGRKQLRQFTIIRRDIEDDRDQQFLVVFSRPADVRDTTFLVQKHIGKDDDRWLYLPSLDLVKRIAGGDKRTSFVGSHFYYEDVSGRQLTEDSHELKATTNEHYIVRNEPKNPSSVEFSEYSVWIDKNTFMPVKTEYLDSNGKLYRKVEAIEIQSIDGFYTATKMRIDDFRSEGYTLTEMRSIKYNLGIPEDVFTERSLRTPPRQWLEAK